MYLGPLWSIQKVSNVDVWQFLIAYFDNFSGIPIKTTMDNTSTVQYAGLVSQLADKARSVVRDLDPTNDLTFLRVRTKKHEIMMAPGNTKKLNYMFTLKTIA